MEANVLTSRFLLEAKHCLVKKDARFPWPKGSLELLVEGADSVLRESLEVVAYVSNEHSSEKHLSVYQRLVLWGDQVGNYVVRENLKKRQGKVLFSLFEFPLPVSPAAIVAAFSAAYDDLKRLDVPPGRTPSDAEVFSEIEERWTSLSASNAH
jgi:hypothetical protein